MFRYITLLVLQTTFFVLPFACPVSARPLRNFTDFNVSLSAETTGQSSNSSETSSFGTPNVSRNSSTQGSMGNLTFGFPYYEKNDFRNLTAANAIPSGNQSSIGNFTGSQGSPANESYREKIKLREEADLSYDSGVANVRINIPKMRYPSVQLEPSKNLPIFQCSLNKSSLIAFDSFDHFDAAVNDWQKNLVRSPSGFVIITSVPCDNITTPTGEKSFLLVKNFTIEKPTKSVRFFSKKLSFEQAVHPHALVDVLVDEWDMNDNEDGFVVDEKNMAVPDPNDDFDEVMDKATGYLDPHRPEYWNQLLPSVSNAAAQRYFGFNQTKSERIPLDSNIEPALTNGSIETVVPHHLVARGWWSNLWKTIRDAIVTVINVIVKGVAWIIGDRTFTPFSASVAFDKYLGSYDSPWKTRKGLLIKKTDKVDLYCIDCGGRGKLQGSARIQFTVADGIKEATFDASGSLALSIGLGIVLRSPYRYDYTKQLFAVPLSPLSIPGVGTIGPEFAMSAGAGLEVNALGNFLVGLEALWSDIDVKLNFNGQSHGKGLMPTFRPFVEGEISISANVFGKLSLRLGVSVLNGLYSKSVSLDGVQDLSARAYSSVGCGLGVSLVSTSTVSVDVIDLKTYNLFQHVQPLLDKCLLEGIKTLSSNSGRSNTSISSTVSRRQIDSGEPQIRGNLSEVKPEGEKSPELGPLRTSHRITSLSRPNNPETSQARILAPELGAVLKHTENGNIYVTSKVNNSSGGNSTFEDRNTKFAVIDGAVVGDSRERLLHAYVDTLSTLGISRLRLSSPERIPLKATIINLYEMPTDNSTLPNALIASTSDGKPYYPVVCAFENLPARLFLIRDPETGLDDLKSRDNVQSVTGGSVTECGFFYLQIGS